MTAPTDLIERLARKWCDEVYPNPHIEACMTAARRDVEFFAEAFAEALDADAARQNATRWSPMAKRHAARWLRSHLPTNEEAK